MLNLENTNSHLCKLLPLVSPYYFYIGIANFLLFDTSFLKWCTNSENDRIHAFPKNYHS